MDRKYKAWIVVGHFKEESPFPMWKRVGWFLPHFASKAKALRYLKEIDMPLGGPMNIRVVECSVSCVPKL